MKAKDYVGWVVALAIGLSSGWVGASSKTAATEARVDTLSEGSVIMGGRVLRVEAETAAISNQLARIETQMSNMTDMLEGLVAHNIAQAESIKTFYAKYGVPLDKLRQDMLNPDK